MISPAAPIRPIVGTLQRSATGLEERLELHQRWLDHAERGVRADLTGATLTDLKLEGVNLRNAILRDTTFLDSNLCGVNLSGADLTNADFRRGNLMGADLSGADLTKANFQFALLGGVYFA